MVYLLDCLYVAYYFQCYLHFTHTLALLRNNKGKISAQGIGCAKAQDRTRTHTHIHTNTSGKEVLPRACASTADLLCFSSSCARPSDRRLKSSILDQRCSVSARFASVVIVFRFLLIRSFAQALKYCIKVLYILFILIMLLKTVCV